MGLEGRGTVGKQFRKYTLIKKIINLIKMAYLRKETLLAPQQILESFHENRVEMPPHQIPALNTLPTRSTATGSADVITSGGHFRFVVIVRVRVCVNCWCMSVFCKRILIK